MASTSHWYAVLLFLGFAALVERLFSTTEPYMDEVFHIPQAQAYCQGGFDVWDPKITTSPGTYNCHAPKTPRRCAPSYDPRVYAP